MSPWPPPLFAQCRYRQIQDGENLWVNFQLLPVSAAPQFFQLTANSSSVAWRKFLRAATPWNYRWGLRGIPRQDLQRLATELMWGTTPPPEHLDQLQHFTLEVGRATTWPLPQICALSYPDLYHLGQILHLLPQSELPPAELPETPSWEQRQAALQRTYQVLRHLGIDPETGQTFLP